VQQRQVATMNKRGEHPRATHRNHLLNISGSGNLGDWLGDLGRLEPQRRVGVDLFLRRQPAIEAPQCPRGVRRRCSREAVHLSRDVRFQALPWGIEKTSIEVTRETAKVSNVLGKRGPG